MATSEVIDNIFEQEPVLDSRIRKYERSTYVSPQPFAAGANPTEITIDTNTGSLDSFSLLDRSYLTVAFKLLKADGTDYSTTAKAQFIQNAWSLFTRAHLYINDSEVEHVENPGMVSHLKRLIESNRESIAGAAAAGSYYPNDGFTFYTVDPIVPPNPFALKDDDNEYPNDANLARAIKRYRVTAGTSVHVRLYLRDIFGFCSVDKAIPGARIKVKLFVESEPKKFLMTSAGSNAEAIRFTGCDLNIMSVRPDNEALRQAFSEFASGKPIPLEFVSHRYQSVTIGDGSTSVDSVIPNSFKRPTAVSILMKLDADYGATKNKDKLGGTLLALGNSRMQMDSKQYPESGYPGHHKGYLHEYETLLQMGGKHNNDMFGGWLDFDKWKNLYPVICYDLRTTRDELAGARSQPPALQWKADLTAAAAATAHVVISGKEVRELTTINGVLTVSSPSFSD